MSTSSDRAFRRASPAGDVGTATALVGPGDMVRWQDRFAVVDDVAELAPGGTYVTLSFVDGRGLPVCLEQGDLAGAELWRHAGRIAGPGD